MTALLKVPFVHYTGSKKSLAAVAKMVGKKFTVMEEDSGVREDPASVACRICKADSSETVEYVLGGDYVLFFDSEPISQIVVLHDCCFLAAKQEARPNARGFDTPLIHPGLAKKIHVGGVTAYVNH